MVDAGLDAPEGDIIRRRALNPMPGYIERMEDNFFAKRGLVEAPKEKMIVEAMPVWQSTRVIVTKQVNYETGFPRLGEANEKTEAVQTALRDFKKLCQNEQTYEAARNSGKLNEALTNINVELAKANYNQVVSNNLLPETSSSIAQTVSDVVKSLGDSGIKLLSDVAVKTPLIAGEPEQRTLS